MASEAKHDSTFNAAKQLYAEQFGDAIVTNTYFKIALLVMALVAGGLIYTNVKTVRMVENFKPLVIRINDIGRAEAVKNTTRSAISPRMRKSNISKRLLPALLRPEPLHDSRQFQEVFAVSWKHSSLTALPRHTGRTTR